MIENELPYIPDYFKNDPNKGILRINICEYEYDKSEFDLNNELQECICEVNRLYDKCNDDRIRCDSDANTEFYKREAIQAVPQKHLLLLNRQLPYITDEDEKLKVEHQLEILKEVTEEMDKLLE